MNRLSAPLLATCRPLPRSLRSNLHFFNPSITAPARNARAYSSEPSAKSNPTRVLATLAILGMGTGAGYFLFSPPASGTASQKCTRPIASAAEAVDYEKVYKAVAHALEEDGYDDGSYGPVFVRLAWHASGTYSKNDGTGGSNGATMRFEPESKHDANAGLAIARDRLEKVKNQFPNISYGDLWTLAGVCAIQEMGGPIIKWRPGRKDVADGSVCAPDGRLPDAALKQDHIRDIFYRMGFNDREIVALIGAHALGRCHTDRSGYEGPWTPSPTMFTNDFFVQVLEKKWVKKNWKGPQQMVDNKTGELMMLPADMAFVEDKEFRKYVEEYAKDSEKFFNDFAVVFQKLLELGVKFKPDTEERTFKPVNS